MADVFDKTKRSEVMSHIKARDTMPERLVRSLLHKLGFRFRLNRSDLPGKPDIVLSRYKTVVLVHGCFWHRHHGCQYAYTPKSKIEFWSKKFDSNVMRDSKVKRELTKKGWHVLTVWECELKKPEQLAKRLNTGLKRVLIHK